MNEEQKIFLKAHAEYLEEVDPNDPPGVWEKHFLGLVPSGDLSDFIKEWFPTLDDYEQAYLLLIFAQKGHVEIAPFLESLDKSKDDIAREFSADARKALEEFLAS